MNKINLKKSIKDIYSDIDRLAFNPEVAGLIKSTIVQVSSTEHRWKVNLPIIVEHYPFIGSYSLLD